MGKIMKSLMRIFIVIATVFLLWMITYLIWMEAFDPILVKLFLTAGLLSFVFSIIESFFND